MKIHFSRALVLGLTFALTLGALPSSAPASSSALRVAHGKRKAPTLGLAPVSVLITRSDVQSELALTKAQREAIKALLKAAKRPPQKARLDADILALLTEGQAIRLQEIRVQLAGLTAVFDRGIQGALGLSEEQVAAIVALLPSGGKGKGGRKPSREELEALIAEILTDEQEAALARMGGLPFPSAP